jgi:hypothetical protein
MNPDHRTLLEIYVTPNLPGSFARFEFLSFIKRTRGSGARRQKKSKGVDEREQHVHETSVRKETVSYK